MRLLASALAASLSVTAFAAAAETVDEVALRYKLAGEVLVGRGDRIVLDKAYGTIDPAGGKPHKAGEQWRLASITKQVTAAMMLRDLEKLQPGFLDVPLNMGTETQYSGKIINGLTLRQMLTHHTGLANPDDTPKNADGVPRFYVDAVNYEYCTSRKPQPGAPFSYNNCDYIMLPAVSRWPAGMAMAKRGQYGVPGFVGGKPEPRFNLDIFGPAGGLLGTARTVFKFDCSLMSGKLMSLNSRAELWKPEGKGSYQALGQWVFPGRLKGCTAPKRIVQRDGEIYGVQARNFIFPDDDLVVIVFTNRSSDDFPLGEVWEGKGFVYDLLSAAAC
jgi:D-alanyl-D-alanine carboxypeptidase